MLNPILKLGQLMASTDPDRIYVENVRSFFKLPKKVAWLLCEMAVKEGYFKKEIALTCPNCQRVIKTVKQVDKNEKISCINCEINEESIYEFRAEELNKIEFYKLNR
jgi:transcription elongation factor Elf1